MEYKAFGPTGPPDDFKKDLAAFCDLDEAQRHAIAEWFLSTDNYDIREPGLPPKIAASTLLPEQFRQAADFIRYVLGTWQDSGIDLEVLERDLLLLGLGIEQRRILMHFLPQLSPVKERVWASNVRRYYNFIGLPTIDDVNIVCEARPLFASLAYNYYEDKSEDSHKRFVGITYLVVMETFSSDSSGNKHTSAIQMTEEMFRRLLRSMERAGEQLDTLKERTNGIAPAT